MNIDQNISVNAISSTTKLDSYKTALKIKTDRLIINFYKDHVGLLYSVEESDKDILITMKREVNAVLDKYKYLYAGILNNLSLIALKDFAFIETTLENLFKDGIMNWGRIISLLSFGAVIATYFKKNNRENQIEPLGQIISKYLLTYQQEWLFNNNDWIGFVDFFQIKSQSSIKPILTILIGLIGISAAIFSFF